MRPRLTDTQTTVLSRAAYRPGNLAMPLPEGLHGAAAKVAVTTMITRGLLEEVETTVHHGAPLWRETGDGGGTTLVATEAGLAAIGIEPVVAEAASAPCKEKPQPGTGSSGPTVGEGPDTTRRPDGIRPGTKQALIIALLQRAEGASIAEIVEVTEWAPHSARGMISGTLKKKLGLLVTSVREEGRGMVYRIG